MPSSSLSGFSDGQVNVWALATTRRGTEFSAITFTYIRPIVIRGLNITSSSGDYYANFVAEQS